MASEPTRKLAVDGTLVPLTKDHCVVGGGDVAIDSDQFLNAQNLQNAQHLADFVDEYVFTGEARSLSFNGDNVQLNAGFRPTLVFPSETTSYSVLAVERRAFLHTWDLTLNLTCSYADLPNDDSTSLADVIIRYTDESGESIKEVRITSLPSRSDSYTLTHKFALTDEEAARWRGFQLVVERHPTSSTPTSVFTIRGLALVPSLKESGASGLDEAQVQALIDGAGHATTAYVDGEDNVLRGQISSVSATATAAQTAADQARSVANSATQKNTQQDSDISTAQSTADAAKRSADDAVSVNTAQNNTLTTYGTRITALENAPSGGGEARSDAELNTFIAANTVVSANKMKGEELDRLVNEIFLGNGSARLGTAETTLTVPASGWVQTPYIGLTNVELDHYDADITHLDASITVNASGSREIEIELLYVTFTSTILKSEQIILGLPNTGSNFQIRRQLVIPDVNRNQWAGIRYRMRRRAGHPSTGINVSVRYNVDVLTVETFASEMAVNAKADKSYVDTQDTALSGRITTAQTAADQARSLANSATAVNTTQNNTLTSYGNRITTLENAPASGLSQTQVDARVQAGLADYIGETLREVVGTPGAEQNYSLNRNGSDLFITSILPFSQGGLNADEIQRLGNSETLTVFATLLFGRATLIQSPQVHHSDAVRTGIVFRNAQNDNVGTPVFCLVPVNGGRVNISAQIPASATQFSIPLRTRSDLLAGGVMGTYILNSVVVAIRGTGEDEVEAVASRVSEFVALPKADKSYVDLEDTRLGNRIDAKADKSYVDTQDTALGGRITTLENAPASGLSQTQVDARVQSGLDAYIGDAERAVTSTFTSQGWTMSKSPTGAFGEAVLANLTGTIGLDNDERTKLAGGAQITVRFTADYIAAVQGDAPVNRLGVEFYNSGGQSLGFEGSATPEDEGRYSYSEVAPAGTFSFRIQLRGWTNGRGANGNVHLRSLEVTERGSHEDEVESLIRRIIKDPEAQLAGRIAQLEAHEASQTTRDDAQQSEIEANTAGIDAITSSASWGLLQDASRFSGVSATTSRTGSNQLLAATGVTADAATEQDTVGTLLDFPYIGPGTTTRQGANSFTSDTFSFTGRNFDLPLSGSRFVLGFTWWPQAFTDHLLAFNGGAIMGEGLIGAYWTTRVGSQTQSTTTTETLATDGANLYSLVIDDHADPRQPPELHSLSGTYTRPTGTGVGAITMRYSLTTNGLFFDDFSEPLPATSGSRIITLSRTIGATTYNQTVQRVVTISGDTITVNLILPAQTAPIGNPGDPTAPPAPIEHRTLTFSMDYPRTTTRTIPASTRQEQIVAQDGSQILVGRRPDRFSIAISAAGTIEDAYLNGVRCRLPTGTVLVPASLSRAQLDSATQYKKFVVVRGNIPLADFDAGLRVVPPGRNTALDNLFGYISRTITDYDSIHWDINGNLFQPVPIASEEGKFLRSDANGNWVVSDPPEGGGGGGGTPLEFSDLTNLLSSSISGGNSYNLTTAIVGSANAVLIFYAHSDGRGAHTVLPLRQTTDQVETGQNGSAANTITLTPPDSSGTQRLAVAGNLTLSQVYLLHLPNANAVAGGGGFTEAWRSETEAGQETFPTKSQAADLYSKMEDAKAMATGHLSTGGARFYTSISVFKDMFLNPDGSVDHIRFYFNKSLTGTNLNAYIDFDFASDGVSYSSAFLNPAAINGGLVSISLA